MCCHTESEMPCHRHSTDTGPTSFIHLFRGKCLLKLEMCPAKFHKNPTDSLGGVADKRQLYMYMKEMVSGGKFPPNFKIPKLR